MTRKVFVCLFFSCVSTHYDEKGGCVERIPVDKACNSSRQCTDNALCSAQHDNTCFCMAGYYGADGKCNSVIHEGQPCTGKSVYLSVSLSCPPPPPQHGNTCICIAGYFCAYGKCNSVVHEGQPCTALSLSFSLCELPLPPSPPAWQHLLLTGRLPLG